MVLIGTAHEHFYGVSRSLTFLRKDTNFTDMLFICSSDEQEKKTKLDAKRTIYCHQAMFAPHSELLRKLFSISCEKDPSGRVAISLANVEVSTIENLVDYLYVGQCTVNCEKENALRDICRVLGLEIDFQKENCDDSPDDRQPTQLKVLRLNPAAKKKVAAKEDTLQKADALKETKVRKTTSNSCTAEKASNGTSNMDDLGAAGTKKRRTSEEDLQTSKTMRKKPRPIESDDDGGQEDAGTVAKSKGKGPEETPAGTKKVKIGPASKMKRRTPSSSEKSKHAATSPSTARLSDSFLTQTIQTCQLCNAFFVSKVAYDEHMDKNHVFQGDKEDDVFCVTSPDETPAKRRKPGPKSKKSLTTIKQERKIRESKLSSSDGEYRPSSAGGKTPKSRKPGPSSKTRPPSSAAEKQPGGTDGRPKVLPISSDSEDENNASRRSPKTLPNSKIRISFKGAKRLTGETKSPAKSRPLCLQNSGDKSSPGGGPRKCKFCDETFEKPTLVKLHTLNHFKEQMYPCLPTTAPYNCPVCSALSRDKITLLRHWCFAHKMIANYCDENDLRGVPISHSDFVPTAGKKSPPSNAKKSAKAPAKARNAISKPSISTSSDSSDVEPKVKTDVDPLEVKENPEKGEEEVKGGEPSEIASNGVEKEPDAEPSQLQVRFSGESEDEMKNAQQTAKQTFDEIFATELTAAAVKKDEEKS